MNHKFTNCQFPIIRYEKNLSFFEWGFHHGSQFKIAINELVAIRKELMLKKNPRLKNHLDQLAHEQFKISQAYAPYIAEEIKGIAQGAECTLTDIVILNNYTDFRDIEMPEEGCTTMAHFYAHEKVMGQTWDMHRSAKNYLCMIEVLGNEHSEPQLILSLVGCVGLMGINSSLRAIGVNNINTFNARAGLIWPLLVRQSLLEKSFDQMRERLVKAPVTSGHNYLIACTEGAEHLEILPDRYESVGLIPKAQTHATSHMIFHTNHCLGPEIKKVEDQNSMSSTTFDRYNQAMQSIESFNQLIKDQRVPALFKYQYDFLTSHQNFPKSICSHFENGAQDPSFTCGGGLFDLQNKVFRFWRGCETHDDDFIAYDFKLSDAGFLPTKISF